MNEKALRVLEYNKIIDKLSEMALSPMGVEIAQNLVPSSNAAEVKLMQEETNESESSA